MVTEEKYTTMGTSSRLQILDWAAEPVATATTVKLVVLMSNAPNSLGTFLSPAVRLAFTSRTSVALTIMPVEMVRSALSN